MIPKCNKSYPANDGECEEDCQFFVSGDMLEQWPRGKCLIQLLKEFLAEWYTTGISIRETTIKIEGKFGDDY
ncbi:MAG: hypothetical protein WC476_01585 [Phycisphaerae bacterium]|jgi:hypothetical protein